MKKQLLLFSFLVFSLLIKAQHEQCATSYALKKGIEANAGAASFYTAEQLANKWLANNKSAAHHNKTKAIIKIPVVFHVVYKNAAQNIPDSNIISQLQVLNECFRKQNANYTNTRPIFDTIGADCEIEFCLADKDPQGNPTTGIIRKSAPSTAAFDPLNGFDAVKSPAKGGDTLWPANQYLNIWTCDMSLFSFTFVLGYAQFPGMNPQTDGVVIQYDYLGKYAKPKFLGKTTVHEVGHWLGMRHIWADDAPGIGQQGTCDSTDFVGDTPNCKSQSASGSCNTSTNTCSNEDPYWSTIDPPDMVENYMDYSSDSCMTMFTKGQKARMYSFLNTNPDRMAITTSTAGCNTYAGIHDIDDFSAHVELFPNPASDVVKLNLKNLSHAGYIYEIYNANGQLITKEALNYLYSEIDVKSLSNGLYFVKVYSEYHTTIKRLVIAR